MKKLYLIFNDTDFKALKDLKLEIKKVNELSKFTWESFFLKLFRNWRR